MPQAALDLRCRFGARLPWGFENSVSSRHRCLDLVARVLKPDGDVRQDIGLLIARDTAAHSAQVSRVRDSPGYGVRQDTDLPSHPCHPHPGHGLTRAGEGRFAVCLRDFSWDFGILL